MGSVQAGTKSNVIPDSATILLNVRAYSEHTRTRIKRIVIADCEASGAPSEPEFELFDHFALTENGPDVTERVAAAFAEQFGDKAQELALQTASEDFNDLPRAIAVPYAYWASAAPARALPTSGGGRSAQPRRACEPPG